MVKIYFKFNKIPKNCTLEEFCSIKRKRRKKLWKRFFWTFKGFLEGFPKYFMYDISKTYSEVPGTKKKKDRRFSNQKITSLIIHKFSIHYVFFVFGS